MKNLFYVCLLSMCVFAYARGPYFGNEYDPEDEKRYHDREMTEEDMKKFRFPKPYGYKEDQFGRKCGEYEPYMRRFYSCPNYSYYYYSRYLRRDRCPEDSCDFVANYGSTYCHKHVELVKPYMQEGRQCENSGMLCSGYKEEKEEDDDDDQSSGDQQEEATTDPEAADDGDDHGDADDGDKYPERERRDLGDRYYFSFRYMYPKPSKPPKCTCQTIWCTKDIWTMYKVGDKVMKGYVRVKVPCRCDCRRESVPTKKEMGQSDDDDDDE